jgi:hypothetical protein
MAAGFLHNRNDFPDLIRIIEGETNILAGLIEKDYWIMHVLYGLKQLGHDFELKGGTSLSKAYKIIARFSEDIDIHIKPPAEMDINENPNNAKAKNVAARKAFYDWLAENIKIDGIIKIERDLNFDNDSGTSGGIRLFYHSYFPATAGVKEGLLLEAGFDTVTPNSPLTISSWAYDKAARNSRVDLIDNRAVDIKCYDHCYTFVEKLQTIATKFRKEQESGTESQNFMRQYYDVYSLLADPQVQEFLGTDAYLQHKQKRFPAADFAIPVNKNQAFLLDDEVVCARFKERYQSTGALYYKGQPEFEKVMQRIGEYIDSM